MAEQSAGYVTLLRDDGEGHAKWIDRHVEDLNKPYGLAWQGDHLLVADQDGIWRVPHVVGAMQFQAAQSRPYAPTNWHRDSAGRSLAPTVPRSLLRKASSASFRDIRTAI